MNKADLISAVAAEAGLSKVDAKKAVEAFVSTVTKALQEGDKVSLIGFGTFSVNPNTTMNPLLVEKHFNRKHGPNAYYGQKKH